MGDSLVESLQKEVLHIVIALLVLFISIPYIYRSYHVSKAEGTESENGEENEEQILLPSATQATTVYIILYCITRLMPGWPPHQEEAIDLPQRHETGGKRARRCHT